MKLQSDDKGSASDKDKNQPSYCVYTDSVHNTTEKQDAYVLRTQW